tara:strand:+ start:4329 stop:4625 length:297 start_codon:yes stop_codon:yes gene_type:complete
MEGKWTPFALSSQKQAGHLINDSTFPREISYGSTRWRLNVPLCLGILLSYRASEVKFPMAPVNLTLSPFLIINLTRAITDSIILSAAMFLIVNRAKIK